jgi:hypothetical protein
MKAPAALALVLGLWMAVILMSGIAGTRSLRTVDEIVTSGHPAATVGTVKLDRSVMRYHAAELNRDLFRWSEWIQLALALIGSGLLRRVPGKDGGRFLPFAFTLCVLILLLQRFYITPQITELGRQMDFASMPLPPELASIKARNGMLHGISVSAEFLKLLALLALSWSVVIDRRAPSPADGA